MTLLSSQNLENKINSIKKEKEESVRGQNFEKAAKLRDEQRKTQEQLEKIRDMTNIVDRGIQGELTAADIMELEENMQLWHGGLQSLMNYFN